MLGHYMYLTSSKVSRRIERKNERGARESDGMKSGPETRPTDISRYSSQM
jgi:hypothetical protein